MTAAMDKSARRSGIFKAMPPVALCLWGCLWLNLNTTSHYIPTGHSLDEWILCIRAVLPFFVLPVALLIVLSQPRLKLPGLGPFGLLFVYGLVAAAASAFSPEPLVSLYWGIAFLAAMTSAWAFLCVRDPLASSRQALQVTWAVTFVVTLIIAYLSRRVIFGSQTPGEYEVLDTLNGLSRSSGVARWAAVPALVCLLKAYHTRRAFLVALYLGAAGCGFFIVYRMQSRGAIFGSIAALAFGMITAGRLRKYALPFLIFGGALLVVTDPALRFTGEVTEYMHRGQTPEEFRSMSGRAQVYEDGMEAFRQAPILGRGNWADRMVMKTHAHNSYLQALLNAGVVGFVPYAGSWIAGWILFFRLLRKGDVLLAEDRLALMEAGAVMMFFTVRSMPETTTASYSVDMLVMASVYVYLEMLTLALERRQTLLNLRALRAFAPVPARGLRSEAQNA